MRRCGTSKPAWPAEQAEIRPPSSWNDATVTKGGTSFPSLVADDEVASGDVHSGKRIHTEGLKLNFAIQPIGQRVDDELPQGVGPGAGTRNYCQQNH